MTMIRRMAALALTLSLGVGTAFAQAPKFPDTAQGKLGAGFFDATNTGDEEALARFQEANFSEAALKRRTAEERKASNRQLRETAGRLTLVEVKSATASQLVVTASGSKAPGFVLTITFSFTGEENPKIDRLQISG
jgi:hypothetical protein